jgi:hypothetical protein
MRRLGERVHSAPNATIDFRKCAKPHSFGVHNRFSLSDFQQMVTTTLRRNLS